MFDQNARLVELEMRLADLAALSAAFPLAYFIRDEALKQRYAGLHPIASYWPLLAMTLLSWLLASWPTGLYDLQRRRRPLAEFLRLARVMAVVACALAALGFLTDHHGISRLFVCLYFALGVLLLWLGRISILALAGALGRGFHTRRFAVVGCGELARAIVRRVGRRAEWGYDFAGFVVDGDVPGPLASKKILGTLQDLPRLLKSHVLDEVVFAMPRERLTDVEAGIRLCEELGISARVCMDLFTPRVARVAVDDFLEIPMLSFTTAPSDAVALALKRSLDLVVSAITLALLLPVFTLIAIAIRLGSPGPVLFRQRRVGKNGREFTLYKFRSMCQDAERQMEELRKRNEAKGPVFKMKRDPRVTRVGAILRRTSLDEFPQFWNVLRGEMSLVGPRPPLPSEVQQYERWQRRRLSIKPGLTCIWQVSGRSKIDFDRWMELDLHYIDHWSLWNDAKLVLKTIPAVFTTRGAR